MHIDGAVLIPEAQGKEMHHSSYKLIIFFDIGARATSIEGPAWKTLEA